MPTDCCANIFRLAPICSYLAKRAPVARLGGLAGLVLSEVARSVDLRMDILDQMELSPVRIIDKPKAMIEPLFAH
jgi:acyl CoA:acetate/3-ketoacid CoA transferase